VISVIINTYNRGKVLARCLRALDRQVSDTPPFEIIVVDDGSDDGTRESGPALCRKLSAPARFLPQNHGGPAAARNLGVDASEGELVLFLGDDILVAPDFVKAHAESDRGDDNAAVVGRTRWHPEIRITPFMRLIEQNGWQFGYGLIQDPANLPYTFLYTSNLSIPRPWFSKARFDEAFRDAAYEDIDLGYRLSRQGMRLTHNPKAIGHHLHPYTFSGFVARTSRVREASSLFHSKHPEISARRPRTQRPASRASQLVGVLSGPSSRRQIGHWISYIVSALDQAGVPLSEQGYLRAMRLIEDLNRLETRTRGHDARSRESATRPRKRSVPGKVSVIIPNHNGLPYLRSLLPTLSAQTLSEFDITIVDDCSTDPAAVDFLKEQPDLNLIHTPRNVGFAGACNTGIRATDGEFVFILNNDTVLDPDCLASLVAEMQAHPEAGVVGCTVLNSDGTVWTSGGILRGGFPRDLVDRFGAARETEHVAFCAVMLRREALEASGPLDERYFMKFEDADLSTRLRTDTDYRIRILPDPLVTHTGVHASLSNLDSLYYRERNRLLFQRKFHPAAAAKNAFRRLPRRIANIGLVTLKRLLLLQATEANLQWAQLAAYGSAWVAGIWGRGGRRPRLPAGL
jgi:GT2 family glycosyltransferase